MSCNVNSLMVSAMKGQHDTDHIDSLKSSTKKEQHSKLILPYINTKNVVLVYVFVRKSHSYNLCTCQQG